MDPPPGEHKQTDAGDDDGDDDYNQTKNQLRHLLEKTCGTTSMHGLPRSMDDDLSRTRRQVWLFLWVAAFIGVSYFLAESTKLFLEYPVSTATDIEHVEEIQFPAVTLCSTSPITKAANYSLIHEHEDGNNIGEEIREIAGKQLGYSLEIENDDGTKRVMTHEELAAKLTTKEMRHKYILTEWRLRSLWVAGHSSDVIKAMSYDISQHIQLCEWYGKHNDNHVLGAECAELFPPESRFASIYGTCSTFNGLGTPNDWLIRQSGKRTGLELWVDLEEENSDKYTDSNG
jgi:hypothetical protein